MQNVIEKVLEDVEKVNERRTKSKQKMALYREKEHSVTSNVTVTGNGHVTTHIREDNIKIGRESQSSPPIFSDVKKYILEKGFRTSPESFFNHYEANGWKIGSNPIKDWRAAINKWESKEPKPHKPPVYKQREEIKKEPMPEEIKEMIKKIGKEVKKCQA